MNKENILNSQDITSTGIQDLKSRQPFTPIGKKVSPTTPTKSVLQQSQQQPQQLQQPSQLQISQGKRIVELEKLLKESEKNVESLKFENEVLKASAVYADQSRANVLINNNRLRLVHRLTEENQKLKEKIALFEQMSEEAAIVDPLLTKQNGVRARKINQLAQQNIELTNELQKARDTISSLQQKQTVVVHKPTSLSPSSQNINYSQNRNLSSANEANYGMDEHHLPGEC